MTLPEKESENIIQFQHVIPDSSPDPSEMCDDRLRVEDLERRVELAKDLKFRLKELKAYRRGTSYSQGIEMVDLYGRQGKAMDKMTRRHNEQARILRQNHANVLDLIDLQINSTKEQLDNLTPRGNSQ